MQYIKETEHYIKFFLLYSFMISLQSLEYPDNTKESDVYIRIELPKIPMGK